MDGDPNLLLVMILEVPGYCKFFISDSEADNVACIFQLHFFAVRLCVGIVVISKNAVGRPFGTSIVEPIVDLFHSCIKSRIKSFVILNNAGSSEVSFLLRVLEEDGQNFVEKIDQFDSIGPRASVLPFAEETGFVLLGEDESKRAEDALATVHVG